MSILDATAVVSANIVMWGWLIYFKLLQIRDELRKMNEREREK